MHSIKVLTSLLISFVFTVGVYAKPLIFATYPSNAPEKVQKAFTPLAKHLSKELNMELKLVVTKDYDELSNGLADGSIDIAWIGSSNFVQTKKIVPNLVYLATYQERDHSGERVIPYYKSVIVALKKSGIDSLKELKGTKFALTDVGSTSGYAYPMLMLKRAGIDSQKDFSKIFLLKKHDKVIEALVAGSIDAGGVSDGTYFNAIKKYGDIFKIVEESTPIPLDPIVCSPKLDKNIATKTQNILAKIDEDSPINIAIKENLGWSAAGFAIKDEAFYDDIIEALSQ